MGFQVAMILFVAAVLVSTSMAESLERKKVVFPKPDVTGTGQHNKIFYVPPMMTDSVNSTVNGSLVASSPVLIAANADTGRVAGPIVIGTDAGKLAGISSANGITTIFAREKRQAAAAAASGNGAASASAAGRMKRQAAAAAASSGGAAASAAAGRFKRGGGNGMDLEDV